MKTISKKLKEIDKNNKEKFNKRKGEEVNKRQNKEE